MSSLFPPNLATPPLPRQALAGTASDAAHWTLAAFGGAMLLLALAWDLSGLDLPVMRLLGGASGFALEHNWWLENLLHTGVQRLCWVVYAALWVGVFKPWHPLLAALSRRERLAVMVAVTAAVLAVSGLKQASLTSCPTMLQEFGGPAHHVSHWAWGVSDGGPGRCFPGGHASSALAFVALALPWLGRPERAARRLGLKVLAWVVGAGLVLGLAQTLRGHHYPSHTLWTLVLCLFTSAAVWALMVPRRGSLPAQADVQGQVDGHAREDGAEHGLATPLAPIEK